MVDWNHFSEKKPAPTFDLPGFADHIQDQANCMDRCGWVDEARHLRKWASELRDKNRTAPDGFEQVYRKER